MTRFEQRLCDFCKGMSYAIKRPELLERDGWTEIVTADGEVRDCCPQCAFIRSGPQTGEAA